MRVGFKPINFHDLNEQLSNLTEEEKKGFSSSYQAYRARSARDSESSIIKSKAWSKLHGGNNTDTDAVMDTGCTFPVTTTTVIKEIKAEIFPLKEELDI